MCLNTESICLKSNNACLQTLSIHSPETSVNLIANKDPLHLQAIEEYDSDSDDIELDITSSPLQCGDNQVFINPLLLDESECDESESLTFSITCDNDSEIVINPSRI